ncbi:hypothetical protein WDU99_11475 [Microbacterium sp. Mu-80]|uniref:Uncharacterized protein n=1 Tax=Microbacterium bandirmense TaxID=3122050 RepID=A0ABU8LDT0_9MICO
MDLIILGAWIVQAVAGIALLVGWARHAHGAGARAVITHVVVVLACLASWIVFVATGGVLWAWLAVVGLCIGIPFGETQMVARSRQVRGAAPAGMRDYVRAIGTVFTGRLPALVTFHAIFSAVVFFGSVGVAIGATIARA